MLCQASKSPGAPPGSNNTGQAGKPSSQAPALQPCPLLAQGDLFFLPSSCFSGTSSPDIRAVASLWPKAGNSTGGDSWPLLLVGTTTVSSHPAAGVEWGQPGPLALCWNPVGSSGAGLRGKEDVSRLPLLPHRQAHTVLAVRGGCFGAIITPALQEAPLSSFLPTCRCMYRPNHQVWLCFGKTFCLFFPAPNLHLLVLSSTTSVPSATCPPRAGSVSMQYSTSSVGHAQLALELGIGLFCN